MKETDDLETITGLDAGCDSPPSPPNSDDTTDERQAWHKEKERTKGLIGYNTQGMKTSDYYYTQREWDRSVGYGQVPEERRKDKGDA